MRSILIDSTLAFGALALSQLAAPAAAPLAADLGLPGLSAALSDVGAAHAAFIRRGKIKRKATYGYKVVVVVGDDAEANEVETVELSFVPNDEAPTPNADVVTLPLKVVKANGNKRFVFTGLDFDGGDAVNFSYSTVVTMLDAEGQVIGEQESLDIEVEDDGDSRLRSVRISQLDDTNFQIRVLVVGDWDGEVATADVSFSDYSGAAPIPEELSLSVTDHDGGRVEFIDQTLTFDDPSGAADEIYNLVVDLKGYDGSSLGSSEYEVVVEGLETVLIEPPSDDGDVAVLAAEIERLQAQQSSTVDGLNRLLAQLGELEAETIDEQVCIVGDLSAGIGDAIESAAIIIEDIEEGSAAEEAGFRVY